jgi:hypothetical protein
MPAGDFLVKVSSTFLISVDQQHFVECLNFNRSVLRVTEDHGTIAQNAAPTTSFGPAHDPAPTGRGKPIQHLLGRRQPIFCQQLDVLMQENDPISLRPSGTPVQGRRSAGKPMIRIINHDEFMTNRLAAKAPQ